MKSLLLLPVLLFLLPASGASWRFVSKVEELPVEITDRLEITRPKVRLCGGDSEESTDCVLCTVCHPHEYELIGCSGQMDSVCASCTTGWLRSTPKTVDFFRKCKKHPQLPLLFPDVPYQTRLEIAPSSMFADQEKMLQHAENSETEASEELSEEDYDGEDEDDEEIINMGVIRETGVEPVDVDERDEDSQEWTSYEKADRASDLEEDYEEPIDEKPAEDVSVEDEDSAEMKDEESADPFDTKTEQEDEAAFDDDEDDSEEDSIRLYPLHKASIWRIIGPEIRPIDDEDLSKEIRKAISERKKSWQLEREISKIRQAQKNIRVESIEILEDYNDNEQRDGHMVEGGGYRPLPVRIYTAEARSQQRPLLLLCWVLCFAILAASVCLSIRICMMVRRRNNRFTVLPELDDMSKQLINEAYARVHCKKDKKPKPEFV